MPNQLLILASASPRRRELLAQLGLEFAVEAASVDETRTPNEAPEAYVRRLASEKAAALSTRNQQAWVLGADTVVVIDGEILGKPVDDTQALVMLRSLAGRKHEVLTGVSLHSAEDAPETIAISTEVEFVNADEKTLQNYVRTKEGRDKAGAYAIQGIGAALIHSIHGSYSNVVGLPLAETLSLLRRHGVVEHWP